MKCFKVIGCLVFLAFAAHLAAAQIKPENYVQDELLVKLKPQADSVAARDFERETGARTVETLGDLGWRRVKLPPAMSVAEATETFLKTDQIEAVQPNYYYHLLNTPNDTSYGSLYGMTKIGAPAAWDFSTGSEAVVVADIDTGLRYTHEDLAANAWTNAGEINGNGIDDDGNGFVDDYYGYDFFYNDPNPFDDAGGHGTHTAGTIGAVGNNGKGVSGVNWNVKIMAIKIYSPNGGDSTSAMLVNAYNYVRMMKNRGVNIRVTNNSYGGCGEACGYDQATKDALDAMGDADILNVFAAGNDNRNIENFPSFPASYTSPSVLAVASSTSTDVRSSFSNYGATSVDLAAPGSGILSTYATSNTSYQTLSGTSMATPHVAGSAALLAAYNPNLSAASLKATLMNTVDVMANWNGLVKTGGRLNVGRALQNQTVCSFALPTSVIAVPTKGGYYTVGINAAQNCDYRVKSNAGWIKVIGADSLSGNSTVTFRVPVNKPFSRTGTLTIAGRTLTVIQSRN